MIYNILLVLQQLNTEASETLKDLSPWAYVIVILVLGFSGVFIKLYLSETKKNDELEVEFRKFMSDTITQQIEVSRDVIDLVTRNKNEIKDALNTVNASDNKVERLITEIRDQLTRIEELQKRYNNLN